LVNAPKLEATGFGWLLADGRRYNEDVVITTEGEIKPRPKELSKKYGRRHTPLGPDEVKIALEGDPEVLVVGMGQFGVLPILEETKEIVAQHGVELKTARMPQAIETYNQLVGEGRRVAAILHLTC